MRDVVIYVMHWNRCAGRRRVRDFTLRTSKTKTLATSRINAHGARRTGVGSAAGAFHGELPVRIV